VRDPSEASSGRALYDNARQLVEHAVAQHIEEWAAAVGLTSEDAQFKEFRACVAAALLTCLQVHIDAPYHRRGGDVHKALKRIAREAQAIAKRLHALEADFDGLPWPLFQHDPIFSKLAVDLVGESPGWETIAAAARRDAEAFKQADKGGKRKMAAFEVLAQALLIAYRQATGQTGVGRSARQGRLLSLVEAVLPIVSRIAREVTGRPLDAPATDSLGEALHRTARSWGA
jgi:hypothetical protein